MGDLPTTTNQTVKTIDEIIHAAVCTVACDAAEAALFAAAPWLNLPVVKQIFDLLFSWLFKYVSAALEKLAAFQIIDIQTHHENASYQSAVDGLQKAIASGDQKAIDAADQEFQDTLGRLIHFDGS